MKIDTLKRRTSEAVHFSGFGLIIGVAVAVTMSVALQDISVGIVLGIGVGFSFSLRGNKPLDDKEKDKP